MSTSVFTESVCEELLWSELNGEKYDPGRSTTQRAWPVNNPAVDTEETDGEGHVLRTYGRKSGYHPDIVKVFKGGYCIQHKCAICGKKTSVPPVPRVPPLPPVPPPLPPPPPPLPRFLRDAMVIYLID